MSTITVYLALSLVYSYRCLLHYCGRYGWKSPEFQAVKEGCDYPFYDECRLSTVSDGDMVTFLRTENTQGYNGPRT